MAFVRVEMNMMPLDSMDIYGALNRQRRGHTHNSDMGRQENTMTVVHLQPLGALKERPFSQTFGDAEYFLCVYQE
jgi:hypothetical protein